MACGDLSGAARRQQDETEKNTRKRGGTKHRSTLRLVGAHSQEQGGLARVRFSFYLTGAWGGGGLKRVFLFSPCFTQNTQKLYIIFKL